MAEKADKKKKGGATIDAGKFFENSPEFVKHRLELWDKIKKEREAETKNEQKPIKITLPDGKVVDGVAFVTTPLEIAKQISAGLAQKTIVAKLKVGDESIMWDVDRPLESDCLLELLSFDHPDAKYVFWHSSAHILGQSLELFYAGHLCVGPPIKTGEGGFYYDIAIPDGKVVSLSDYEVLQAIIARVVKEKQNFERLVLTKQQALDLFNYSKYKSELISKKVPDGATCTAYRCGPLIDLCKGPHVPNTGRVKAFEITKSSSAYWLGNPENDSLQRIYGISFPDAKSLKEWKIRQEEAAKRDHRVIGTDQDLFFFHPLSPGSPFMLPLGTRILNKMYALTRNEYRVRGFQEVVTPNMYNADLWKISGHWENYRENMFTFQVENQDFGLKPMNCPGHCLAFKHRVRSYRELPLRIADFGVLHRNELSGALTGLTRVRRFCQDDAHIFCAANQVESELKGALEFMEHMYVKIFGFKFDLELSTRPEKSYIGSLEVWNNAEEQLKKVLEDYSARTGRTWKLNPGDGAFYGPKIDIHITDAIGRSHQCATIQLDFNLPSADRFDLEFQGPNGLERPVMIHRAIYGSLERFFAILIEHTAGLWPLWLSPRQILVVPVSSECDAYAYEVSKFFFDAGFYIEVEDSDKTFNKKLAVARDQKLYNYVFVVGAKEIENRTVNLRNRSSAVLGEKKWDEVLELLKKEVEEYI